MTGSTIKADCIVIAPSTAADGGHCTRFLMVGENGQRMTIDLHAEATLQLAGYATMVAEGAALKVQTIYPEF